MQLMGLAAIYRRPNTSKPAPGHKIYPYLLRGLEINRDNQVWATSNSTFGVIRGHWWSLSCPHGVGAMGSCGPWLAQITPSPPI